MSMMLAHVTGQDTTTIVTAFVLGLTLGAALVFSAYRVNRPARK
jgi:hypothetical protein